MVLELEKNRVENFSFERLEGAMLSANVTWDDVNKELGFDAKSMLKNKNKPPMLNVIVKVSNIVGLNDLDYIMMRSNSYKINSVTFGQKINNKTDIDINNIDVDKLHRLIRSSDWSYWSISTLTSTDFCNSFYNLKRIAKISVNDLGNLCWAVGCKISDVCNTYFAPEETIPCRSLNNRQKYIIDQNKINSLSDNIDKMCKYAHIPSWFLYSDQEVRVTLEMLDRLRSAIARTIGENITRADLCINYNGPKDKPIELSSRVKISDKRVSEAMKLLETKTYEEVSKITKISTYSLRAKAKELGIKKYNRKEKEKMDIPNEVKEAVATKETTVVKEEKAMNKTTTNQVTETTNNEDKNYSNNDIKQIKLTTLLDTVGTLSNAKIDELIMYLEGIKNLRLCRNNFLK